MQEFNFILHNVTSIMINQLLQSSEHERRRKRVNPTGDVGHLSRLKMSPLSFLEEEQSPFQSQMSVQVVRLTPQQSHLHFQEQCQDLQQTIRSKLKLKKVYLPKIQYSYSQFTPLSTQARSYEVSRLNLGKPTIKQRFRTQGYESFSEQDESERVCEAALIQIRELNKRFKKYNEQADKRSHQKTRAFQLSGQKDKSRQRVRFNHPSRQEEFELYVKHLQNSYNGHRTRGLRDFENHSQLMNRVQPRKGFRSRLENPEVSWQTNRVGQLQSSANAQRGLQSKVINREQEGEEVSQKARERLDRVRKQRELHDNFIKLLRKVKNRGESLLVKLKKYPSRKLGGK